MSLRNVIACVYPAARHGTGGLTNDMLLYLHQFERRSNDFCRYNYRHELNIFIYSSLSKNTKKKQQQNNIECRIIGVFIYKYLMYIIVYVYKHIIELGDVKRFNYSCEMVLPVVKWFYQLWNDLALSDICFDVSCRCPTFLRIKWGQKANR